MGLLDVLSIGRSTVDAARAGVQLTSHNIANVNTEGFHRRRLQLSPIAPPPVLGGGVQVEGGARVADPFLARRLASGLADEARAGARETLLVQLERRIGDLGEHGLGATIATFFAKLSALATSPADATVRGELLAAAGQVSSTFQGIAADLRGVAETAEQDLVASVAQVNSKALEVAKLNAEIAQAEIGGEEASDLRDRRDLCLAELATLAGASSFVDGSGQVTVLVAGQTLVQGGHAATLEAVPDVALGGRSRIDLVDGAARTALTSRLTTGKLAGLIAVRDATVPQTLAALDQLAYDLATAVNATHRAGFGLDGVGNRDLFAPLAAATGAAAALQLRGGITASELAASSTAAGVPGNGENALALVGLERQLLAGGGSATFAGQAAAIIGGVGSASAAATRDAELTRDQRVYLETLQRSSDGVSLDEEMTKLIEYQRAYQAGAKVLAVADELLQTVLRL